MACKTLMGPTIFDQNGEQNMVAIISNGGLGNLKSQVCFWLEIECIHVDPSLIACNLWGRLESLPATG